MIYLFFNTKETTLEVINSNHIEIPDMKGIDSVVRIDDEYHAISISDGIKARFPASKTVVFFKND